MKKLKASEIRKMWTDFFIKKGHEKIESAPLIPKDDPTLLFTNAGVAPLKKYFDGTIIPTNKKMTSVQKCIRTNDIENVGNTARHHTFFEMLGNFSVGDYFKKEAINFAYELLFSKKYFAIDLNKIYITYYPTDDVCKSCWLELGISPDRLIKSDENFWEIGEGPSGPCTEIFYDRGPKYDKRGPELIKKDIENDRFIELWNIVFSQFDAKVGVKRENYKELPNKNIDTGAGLERFACISQNVKTNFETDLFMPIIREIEKLSKVKYNDRKEFKVIADHIRTIFMALYDGAVFSNLGRGYVLRRLLRRAMKMGHFLKIKAPFLAKLTDSVFKIFEKDYILKKERLKIINEMITQEELRFSKNLKLGEKKIKEIIKSSNKKIIKAQDAFLLFDTFGFPIELTMEYASENNFKVDTKGFTKLLKKAQEKSRKNIKDVESMGSQNKDYLKFNKKSEYLYDEYEMKAKIIKIFPSGIILDKTPFYAESGGQVSDEGVINNRKVKDVIKLPNGQHLHKIDISQFKEGEIVEAKINKEKRLKTQKNHTATHLLHKALKIVLGDHISQQGSKVDENFLRFDFNHFKDIKDCEILEVEKIVKESIKKSIKVSPEEMPIEDAKKIGAEMLFGEKYGKIVRVLKVGSFSVELCGGTHVKNTKDINDFAIVQLFKIGSGIYRIIAITGSSTNLVKDYLKQEIKELKKFTKDHPTIKVKEPVINFSYQDIINYKNYLTNLKEDIKKLVKTDIKEELKKLKDVAKKSSSGKKEEIFFFKDEDPKVIKDLIDDLFNELNLDNIIILNNVNGRTGYFVKSGTNSARDLINKLNTILSGRGGGSPTFSQGSTSNKADQKSLKDIFK